MVAWRDNENETELRRVRCRLISGFRSIVRQTFLFIINAFQWWIFPKEEKLFKLPHTFSIVSDKKCANHTRRDLNRCAKGQMRQRRELRNRILSLIWLIHVANIRIETSFENVLPGLSIVCSSLLYYCKKETACRGFHDSAWHLNGLETRSPRFYKILLACNHPPHTYTKLFLRIFYRYHDTVLMYWCNLIQPADESCVNRMKCTLSNRRQSKFCVLVVRV